MTRKHDRVGIGLRDTGKAIARLPSQTGGALLGTELEAAVAGKPPTLEVAACTKAARRRGSAGAALQTEYPLTTSGVLHSVTAHAADQRFSNPSRDATSLLFRCLRTSS